MTSVLVFILTNRKFISVSRMLGPSSATSDEHRPVDRMSVSSRQWRQRTFCTIRFSFQVVGDGFYGAETATTSNQMWKATRYCHRCRGRERELYVAEVFYLFANYFIQRFEQFRIGFLFFFRLPQRWESYGRES